MTAYSFLVRLHRYLGLTTAAFLVVAGLSGSVIAFHGELDAWLNPDLFHASGTRNLSPSLLAERVEMSDARINVAFVETNVRPGRSAMLYVEPKAGLGEPGYNQVFANPASGEVLGRRQYGKCCFQREAVIPFIYNLHRRLTMPGRWGEWLMGGVAILWLVDCFVAFAIAAPRRFLAVRGWRAVLRVRTGTAYRVTFDLHRAAGLWLWGVLAIIAFSSVYLNLGDAVVRPIVSIVSPLAPSPYDRGSVPALDGRSTPQSFDQILEASRPFVDALGPDYFVTGIYYDRHGGIYVADFGTDGESLVGFAWAAFDAVSGKLIGRQIPGEGSVGDIVLQLQFPLHSGRVAGLPGRIVICLTGIAIAILSVTGIVIWWRKRRARMWG